MVFVTVTGIDELITFLEEISSEKKVEQVIKLIAERTALIAYRLAPEDTGKMEENIRIEKTGDNGYEVVCDIPYAVHNEFGTYCMPIGSEENPLAITSTSGKSAYRPFLRPACYQVLDQMEEIINSVFFGQVKSL